MSYQIDAHRVAVVVTEANRILSDKNFNHGEVMLGLSELLGRIIVATAKTKIQADEMKAIIERHINKTVQIGADAQEKRIITEF